MEMAERAFVLPFLLWEQYFNSLLKAGIPKPPKTKG